MTYALWTVQGLLALLFLFAGGIKLVLPLEQLAGSVPLPGLFVRFLGVAEVLGALGLILPGLLRVRPGLTPLAATGLVLIMIGATGINLAGGDVSSALIALVVGLLAAFVAYGRWRNIVFGIAIGITLAAAALAHTVFAQSPHMRTMPGMAGAALPGQDAFGAMAEIVRILDADPATDWTKVDVERLRQHLIDMNAVVLHAAVKPSPVPGGLAMDVTGTGRTEPAIRAMVVPHAAELDRMGEWSATTATIPGGVRLTVVARKTDDEKLVARIRGLGFAGLITVGAHHQPHHLAMARGDAVHTH